MRKHYLDNIRFLTIFFVVIFHVYFYYNNIGTEAMFAGLKPYEGAVTFAGIYQYFVYPWFMLLLFVVAGISARYALEKRTERQFLKESVDKILAPSTLGVLAFGWLGGYVIYLHTARGNMPESVPAFVRVIIILCCGIGALWFCHVLFVAALFLLLIRKIAGKCSAAYHVLPERHLYSGIFSRILPVFEGKCHGKNKKCSAPIGHLCSCKRHILYRKMLWNGIYGQRCTVKMGFKPVCIFYGFARAWCRSKMA